MKVMEAIVKGFGISSKSWGILTILFIFNVLWNLAPLPFGGNVQDPAKVQMSVPLLILTAFFILINIFIQSGVFGMLKDMITSEGKAVPLGNFVKYGGKFYLRMFVLGVIILLGIALAVLIIGAIFSIGALSKNTVIAIISGAVGIILAAVALYYLFLVFFSPYILIIEDTGIFKSIKSSMHFVKKNFMKMAGLSTLLVLIGLGMGFIVGVLTGIVSIVAKGTVFQIIASVLTGAVSAYITVVISAALMLYYSVTARQG